MKRPSYHHGDLANALTTAATELARDGGPEAVVLREAARKVGVSATAAYRHFSSHGDLMHSVKELAAAQLAERMRAEIDRLPAPHERTSAAQRRLRALGLGYLRFALAEPGLFRTAFCRAHPDAGMLPGEFDLSLVAPYQMLIETIDELAASGAMPADRRPCAEVFAWAAVHGLAMLLLDGPLARCSPDEQDEAIEATLSGVAAGLTAP